MTQQPGGNIKCPRCFSQRSRVRDSRGAVDMNAIRRRRHCIGCGHKYTTYESTVVPEEYELAQKLQAASDTVDELQRFIKQLLVHIKPGEYDGNIKRTGQPQRTHDAEKDAQQNCFVGY